MDQEQGHKEEDHARLRRRHLRTRARGRGEGEHRGEKRDGITPVSDDTCPRLERGGGWAQSRATRRKEGERSTESH